MKIRNGFVSNSSSSSFIIQKNDKLLDTVSIAKNMLKDYFTEYSSYHSDGHPKKQFIIDNLKYLKRLDSNTPIMFYSTNYDTYILNIGDGYFYINTCNNVNWDIEKYAIRTLPESIKNEFGESIKFYNSCEVRIYDETDDDFLYDDNNVRKPVKKCDKFLGIKYFKVDSGFFIQKTTGYRSCNKCYHELFVVGNKVVCLHCDGEKIYRSLKINKIKKLIR